MKYINDSLHNMHTILFNKKNEYINKIFFSPLVLLPHVLIIFFCLMETNAGEVYSENSC